MLSPFLHALAGAFRPPPAPDQAQAAPRYVLVTDGEELEATPAVVAGFCGLMRWSLARLAKACAEVAAEDGLGFPPSLATLRAYVSGDGDLSRRTRAVLEETLGRHCWVAVERDRVGLVLKGRRDGR